MPRRDPRPNPRRAASPQRARGRSPGSPRGRPGAPHRAKLSGQTLLVVITSIVAISFAGSSVTTLAIERRAGDLEVDAPPISCHRIRHAPPRHYRRRAARQRPALPGLASLEQATA
jgi:hypothetical protein